ncbi:MAG: SGNH/GDSL hydrolase family protein [Eubacterium sp.]|nr:SGNH/GDSL hydrolase family protein [Eubacterium sp.]
MKKNILLLGDSIRLNYQDYVKDALEKEANVYFPGDNGRFAQFTLRYFHDWWRSLSEGGAITFDIIHFNTGLWDILRLSNEDELFTPEDMYREMLLRIYHRMKYFCPDAKIIFALTTTVIEPGFEPGEYYGKRCNSDIEHYNQIAIELFESLEEKVDIDDLYSVSLTLPTEAHSDSVHFETDMGIAALGNQVVNCLRRNI